MSQASSPTIARRKRQARSTGFERLRAAGLVHLQSTSGLVWTDHNVHDPGITLLESLCFALTELAYRAEFPVADLLTGPDGQIDYTDLALHPPQRALPCHALTAADHRRRLLDLTPGLDDVRLEVRQPGVLSLQIKLSDTGDWSVLPQMPSDNPVARLAARTWRAERPLGEDLAPQLEKVVERTCDLWATLEMGGSADAAQVVAEVYARAAAWVDRVARLATRRDLVEQGLSLDQIHDGPEALHGFTVAEQRRQAATSDGRPDGDADLLYVDDIVEQVRQVRGVKAVLDLYLQTEQGVAVRSVLPWAGPGWALRLRVPGRPGGTAPFGVTLQRRAHQLELDPADVWRRVQDLRAVVRGERQHAARSLKEEETARLPKGRHRPPGNYVSLQHHLPAVYGVGAHGVPPSYGRERQAKAQQLQAYLMLFDQTLANGLAQLSHLHELFSARQAGRRTVWWQVLRESQTQGEPQVPGLGQLMDASPQAYEDDVLRPLDEATRRRHQLLDHLLALNGEVPAQNAMRLHCDHLDDQETEALLLRNKAAWLKDVVMLARMRSRGFNDALSSWPRPGHEDKDPYNTSGLARRVALLLGFERAHARRLAGAAVHRCRHAALQGALKLVAAGTGLLRAAATRGRLSVVRGQQAQRHDLWLRPDEAEGTQPLHLARCASLLRAQRMQRWLRAAALRWQDRSEGLHLVEHVLLRPTDKALGRNLDECGGSAWYTQRVTAVFPDWTVRTAKTAFRSLAQETLRLNCPAHLLPGQLWLGPRDMHEFEQLYGAWLESRRHWLLDPSLKGASELDRLAAGVRAWLQAAEGRAS